MAKEETERAKDSLDGGGPPDWLIKELEGEVELIPVTETGKEMAFDAGGPAFWLIEELEGGKFEVSPDTAEVLLQEASNKGGPPTWLMEEIEGENTF